MKISKPIWNLSEKHGNCPHCDDQSWLTFMVCSNCKQLVLDCGVHTFKAELPINGSDDEDICPYCKGSSIENKDATSEQIQAAGFKAEDYG